MTRGSGGYKGLQGLRRVTGGDKGLPLQGVTRGYRESQGVRGGDKYTGLQGVIGSDKGLQRVTRGYRGVTRGYRGLQKVTGG